MLTSLWRAFDATRGEDPRELTIVVAGRAVSLRCADEETVERMRLPFHHLRSEESSVPALEVDCWTGGDFPLPGPLENGFGERGLIKEGGHRAYFDAVAGLIAAIEAGGRQGWYWSRDGAAAPVWERVAPMRPLWKWWLASIGQTLLHGAGVALDDRGVLLVGPSGAGKSTLALECYRAGLGYAGDDYVAVDAEELRVSSVYSSVKADRERLAGVADVVSGGGFVAGADQKHAAFLGGTAPLSAGFRAVAVVMPFFDPDLSDPVIERADPAEAMRAMAAPTVLQLPEREAHGLSSMARLAEGLPAFRLHSGPDPTSAVAIIEELIAS